MRKHDSVNLGKFFEIIAMRSDHDKDYILSYLPIL